MDRKAKYIVVVVVVVAIVVFMTLYSWFWLFYNVQEPCPQDPIAHGKMEKVDGDYRITIVGISNYRASALKLNKVKVILVNRSGNITFQHFLNDLVDNESSEIIFYDNDGDSTFSVGDVFIVRGDFVEHRGVEHGGELIVGSIITRNVLYEAYF